MAHKVKCYYCNMIFDRDKTVDCVAVSARRYAHLECHINAQSKKSQEEQDLEALEEYILQLLQLENITPRVRKQINDFKAQYNYTYTGMRKALVYFYEVKGNSKDKANGGIGIVPYIYEESYRYFFEQWQRKQKNAELQIDNYVPQSKVVTIVSPKKTPIKKRLFSFLD